MNINFVRLDENIKYLQYPVIFLFRIISYKNELEDDNINMIIRLFFKHHLHLAILGNLKILLENEFNDFKITMKTITDFYKFVYQKMIVLNILNKWFQEYNNPTFWDMDIDLQIEYLIDKKNHFQSVFDSSDIPCKGLTKSPKNYLSRIKSLLDNNFYRKEILDDIVDRILIILTIFDINIFTLVNIPLIHVLDFYNLSNYEIVEYMIIIYNKMNQLLCNTIDLFETFNTVSTNINKLLNPYLLTIKSQNIDSETEIEDIDLFC